MFGVGHVGRLGAQASGGGIPWLPLVGGIPPSFFADFSTEGTTNRYWYLGAQYAGFTAWKTATSATFTRASTATYVSGGVVATAGSGAARFPGTGLRLTNSQTELTLWNRDLTNAAWTATTCTVVKNQVGADGVAASASSLTASAGNATVLQAITSGSAARTMGAYVKRITGTGEIDITQDNGATWTSIPITGAYAFYTLPTATLANPTVGFRIVTNGDAIAVDFVSERTAAFIADVIPTTTVTVTQAADSFSIPTAAWFSSAGGTLAFSGAGQSLATQCPATFTNGGTFSLGPGFLSRMNVGLNDTSYDCGGSGTNAAIASGGSNISAFKFATVYNIPTALQRVVDVNGSTAENLTTDFTGVGTTALTIGALNSGGTFHYSGNLKSIAYYPIAASVIQARAMLATVP